MQGLTDTDRMAIAGDVARLRRDLAHGLPDMQLDGMAAASAMFRWANDHESAARADVLAAMVTDVLQDAAERVAGDLAKLHADLEKEGR